MRSKIIRIHGNCWESNFQMKVIGQRHFQNSAWPIEVDAEAGAPVSVAIRPEALVLDGSEQRGRTPPRQQG